MNAVRQRSGSGRPSRGPPLRDIITHTQTLPPPRADATETLESNARRGGAKVRWLDADDLRREFPRFRRGHRALLEEQAGFLRATDCITTLRDLAEKHGFRFATGHDAAVSRNGGGVEVRTDMATYLAPQVVVAAGGWSKRLFPELGRALWQCQQGIMYLEGVPTAFCRPAFVPYSGADTGFYGRAPARVPRGHARLRRIDCPPRRPRRLRGVAQPAPPA